MRYPPEEYSLRRWADYGTYVPPGPERGLGGALLIHVDESVRISGPFRFQLTGNEMLVVELPVPDCIAMGGSADYQLRAQVLPRDILIRENMMTSDWMDLEER
jgi:hypothetical protein